MLFNMISRKFSAGDKSKTRHARPLNLTLHLTLVHAGKDVKVTGQALNLNYFIWITYMLSDITADMQQEGIAMY